jgi:integrase
MPIKQTPEGGYDISVCVNYRRAHRRLPPGTTASSAELVEAELRVALERQTKPTHGDPLLVSLLAAYAEHVEAHLSSPTNKYHALRIWRWIEGKRASDTRAVVAKIKKDLRPVYAAGTINRSLGALSKALADGWQRGACAQDWSSLVKRLPEHNERTQTWTLEQIREIADCASERVRVAIWASLFTGCRRGEICKVEAENIDLDGRKIKLLAGNTKTRRYREVPIAAAARPWVKQLPLGIGFEGVKSGWQRARVKAGYPTANFHDLRRSCGTLLIQAGVPLHQVSQILGHSSTQVTEKRYAFLLEFRGLIWVLSGEDPGTRVTEDMARVLTLSGIPFRRVDGLLHYGGDDRRMVVGGEGLEPPTSSV